MELNKNVGIQLERTDTGVWIFIARERADSQMRNMFGDLPDTFSTKSGGMIFRVWKHSKLSLGLTSLRTTSWWCMTDGVIENSSLGKVVSGSPAIEAPDKLVEWIKIHTDNTEFPSNTQKNILKRFGLKSDEEYADLKKCLLCMRPAIAVAMRPDMSNYRIYGYSQPTTFYFGVCQDHADYKNDRNQKLADETVFRVYAIPVSKSAA